MSIEVLNRSLVLNPADLLGYVEPMDTYRAVVSGTLIEGIGNPTSDIDICVIVPARSVYGAVKRTQHMLYLRRDFSACRDDHDEVFSTVDYFLDTNIQIDVEYWTDLELESLVRKIECQYQALLMHSDNFDEIGLSKLETQLIHRMLVGVALSDAPDWLQVLKRRLHGPFCYILYRAAANHYGHFRDLVGACIQADAAMMLELARAYLLREIRGFLHLRGISNPREKWTLTYLRERLRSPLQQRLCTLPFEWSLSHPMKYLQSIFAAVEEIEAHNRPLLDRDASLLSCVRSLELLQMECARRTRADRRSIEQEYEFRRRTYDESGPSYLELLRLHVAQVINGSGGSCGN